jgi:regulator of replication initiation timing
MTTEQIIKALEKEYDRHHKLEEDLNIELNIAKNLKNTLALIKELQAHNENLKKENKYLRERLAEEMEHKEDMEGKDGH